MDVRLKRYGKSIFSFCLIYILAIQPIDSQEEKEVLQNSTTKAIISRLCRSPNVAIGQCIPLSRCNTIREFANKNRKIASQVIRNSLCPGGNSQSTVCCPFNSYTYRFPSLLISSLDQDNSKNKPLTPPRCGRSSATLDRVVGGSPAEIGAWPWISLLGYGSNISDGVTFLCGGSLVSSRTVLTAAHCVYRKNNLKVIRLGEHDFGTKEGSPTDYLIRMKIIHPRYNPNIFENDIALLILNTEVQFSNYIRPICLPIADDLKKRNFVRNFPFVAGWGAIRSEGPSSPVLLQTQVPVVDTVTCKNQYKNIRNIFIDNRTICAGYAQGGKDACQGDSGGPLMFPVKNFYYLIGIVSSGYKCAEPGFPGIYTRVTYFLDFILENLQ